MNKDINIKEIIDFIKLNLTKDSALSSNLEIIETGEWESKAYYKFIDSNNPNQPGSKGQFKKNIILQHPKYKTIILDILENAQLGGIEFIKFI